jgi:hypothetical protein
MKVEGGAEIEGPTAKMKVRFGDEPAASIWTLIKRDGRWLLNDATLREQETGRPR